MIEGDYKRPELTRKERKYLGKLYPEPINLDDTIELTGIPELHHLVPVYYAMSVLRWSPEDINSPLNVIALDRAFHKKRIHLPPNEVKERIEHDEPYWNTEYDEALRLIAFGRAMLYLSMGGEPYPQRKRKTAV